MKFIVCPNCGKHNSLSDDFCEYCGAKLTNNSSKIVKNSKLSNNSNRVKFKHKEFWVFTTILLTIVCLMFIGFGVKHYNNTHEMPDSLQRSAHIYDGKNEEVYHVYSTHLSYIPNIKSTHPQHKQQYKILYVEQTHPNNQSNDDVTAYLRGLNSYSNYNKVNVQIKSNKVYWNLNY